MCLLRGTDWVFIYNSTFCPHSVFMCFVWISEQTAIISLYSITWLVFITETVCVYCAVRAGSVYIIQVNFHFQIARSMTEEFTDTGLSPRRRGFDPRWTKLHWDGFFFHPVLQLPLSATLHQCSTLIFHLNFAVMRRQTSEEREPSQSNAVSGTRQRSI